ncbi:sugar transferase [Dyadobacter sp. CY347]|uniref:sugar transferase n=1 Tax=Dyadobacter sp. CY347 TaxID=2909336 RepID=UPI001F1B8634|nr:sugar transferase [Dyadobacter sp. CY347]MCF2490436.1 sugar transferase [Dyadobacter sp. CY347]
MTFSKQPTEPCEKQTRNITRSFSDVVYFKIGKRVLDIFLAATGLIILSPLFFIISSVLWFETKGNVFFFQRRPGLGEAIFVLIKFRTLTDAQRTSCEPDAPPSILPFGEFLRRSSLDEIPQLWNVLKGDMSLVGPRPLLPEYLDLYNAEQRKRHKVLPGLTGWAQVNGRTQITWDKKFEFDIWYVENRSFKLDIKILYLTFLLIFEKTSEPQESSFERFEG